jgi:tRNA U34 5-methylaminomethyl-2-thiouridine-forming methyltransferase MnmC
MIRQLADLNWTTGQVPVSTRFGDPYFSLDNGLAETTHVFLAGNDLPARFAPGFTIAELGFGTGLNLLATWAAWERSGQTSPLIFTSFEAWPMRAPDMSRALLAFPELTQWSDRLLDRWQEGDTIKFDSLHLNIIIGDARQTLPQWPGKADAWYLDGFSPAKNPELWGDALMAQVARHTNPSGTAATYTAAGFVRRGLAAAGFEVTRTKGFGHKRHMTKALLA